MGSRPQCVSGFPLGANRGPCPVGWSGRSPSRAAGLPGCTLGAGSPTSMHGRESGPYSTWAHVRRTTQCGHHPSG